MFSTVPSRYTVRIVATAKSGPYYELFDTQASRGVKCYRSHALAVSDMSFLNTLLAPPQQTVGERCREPKVTVCAPIGGSDDE